ncbi:RNA polymerase sigma factor [Lactococcus insecticola]|uniref:RNA polymerase sigma-70 region 4 domain-containing protein n=1 Tax=Pseudolactococcus insecticola TaxID=2709158 RepID=A0A6A0B6G9_9LACT|nr:sigma-70 family RNA polymerase sigma factor [Lactococcus insecticola]GFH40263.1 hypothetical protein Hs20B_06610 [Lactococcus insecticola]
MRKFKTGKQNRINYIYYPVKGARVQLTPSEVSDDTFIEILHHFDDEELNAERRIKEYRHETSLNEIVYNEDGNESEVGDFISDTLYNPLGYLLQKIEDEEHQETLEKLRNSISELTPLQQETIQMKFFENMTNVRIAAIQGKSETAVRKCLKGAFQSLKKKLS